jgi:hypothetical protein
MPEIGLSGSMSGEWKRRIGHRATHRRCSPNRRRDRQLVGHQ